MKHKLNKKEMNDLIGGCSDCGYKIEHKNAAIKQQLEDKFIRVQPKKKH